MMLLKETNYSAESKYTPSRSHFSVNALDHFSYECNAISFPSSYYYLGHLKWLCKHQIAAFAKGGYSNMRHRRNEMPYKQHKPPYTTIFTHPF